MRPWFDFCFWLCICCLSVYIVCFPTYLFSSLFSYLSPPLLIFPFENRPAPFPGCPTRRLNLALVFFGLFCVIVHFFSLLNACYSCVRFNFYFLPSQTLQMEKDDKGSTMIRMGVSGWMFLLVPAYPGCPRSKAIKRSLLLLLLFLPSQAIGLGKRLWNDLFCVKWDMKQQLCQSAGEWWVGWAACWDGQLSPDMELGHILWPSDLGIQRPRDPVDPVL